MAVKQSKAAVIVKKKVWLPIIAPALFNNQHIGEIYVEEPAKAVGRKVTVSLMTLIGDPQRQNIHIGLTIHKLDNNQLHTQLFGYSIAPAAVRKMMRRSRERIDESFVVKTQDGVAVRIKPVLITRSKTKDSVLAHLRHQLRITIARALSKMPFIDFFNDLVSHKFQRELHGGLNKIYPLQICELRDMHIETREKGLKNILAVPAAPAPAQPPEPPTQESPAPEAA